MKLTLLLIALAAPAQAAAAPSITLSKTHVPKGGILTVDGQGWNSPDAVDAFVDFTLRGPHGARVDAGRTVAYNDGTWRFKYKVRHDLRRGAWRIVARQDRTGGGVTRAGAFTVTRRPARILSDAVSAAHPTLAVRTLKAGAIRVRVSVGHQPALVGHLDRRPAGRHVVPLKPKRHIADGERALVEITLVPHGNQPGFEPVTAAKRVRLTH